MCSTSPMATLCRELDTWMVLVQQEISAAAAAYFYLMLRITK